MSNPERGRHSTSSPSVPHPSSERTEGAPAKPAGYHPGDTDEHGYPDSGPRFDAVYEDVRLTNTYIPGIK